MIGLHNWAGDLRYRAARLHEPGSIEEVQRIVSSARSIRALGTRHSFSDIADTEGDLVSLARMPRLFDVDASRSSVTIDGAVRYGELCARLDAAGLALHNLASLPHISVAGACTTATHGSGDRSGNLATAVSSLDIVAADGEIRTFHRERLVDGSAGAVVSLGALGVVVRLRLDVQPRYLVRQDVYEDLPLAAFADHFDVITSAADSVSVFTDWRAPAMHQVWLKRRVIEHEPFEPGDDLFGARPATVDRHPIRGLSADAATPQLGVPGAWHERLPHFRMDRVPSAGNELQSEYLVPRQHAVEAVLAIDRLRELIAPLVQVSEIRTVAADDLWLSPSFGQDTVGIHFTWTPDRPAVERVLPRIETCLEPYQPRPHWAKLFSTSPEMVRARYPKLAAFVRLASRLDPDGKFRNRFVDRYIFGA